jgi:hypothetical protein
VVYTLRMDNTQRRLDELDELNRPLTVEEAAEFERLWQQRRLAEIEAEEW